MPRPWYAASSVCFEHELFDIEILATEEAVTEFPYGEANSERT